MYYELYTFVWTYREHNIHSFFSLCYGWCLIYCPTSAWLWWLTLHFLDKKAKLDIPFLINDNFPSTLGSLNLSVSGLLMGFAFILLKEECATIWSMTESGKDLPRNLQTSRTMLFRSWKQLVRMINGHISCIINQNPSLYLLNIVFSSLFSFLF